MSKSDAKAQKGTVGRGTGTHSEAGMLNEGSRDSGLQNRAGKCAHLCAEKPAQHSQRTGTVLSVTMSDQQWHEMAWPAEVGMDL